MKRAGYAGSDDGREAISLSRNGDGAVRRAGACLRKCGRAVRGHMGKGAAAHKGGLSGRELSLHYDNAQRTGRLQRECRVLRSCVLPLWRQQLEARRSLVPAMKCLVSLNFLTACLTVHVLTYQSGVLLYKSRAFPDHPVSIPLAFLTAPQPRRFGGISPKARPGRDSSPAVRS